MSPKTKLLIIAIVVAFFLSFLLYLMDVQLRFGGYYTRAYFILVIAIAICLLLTRIAEKLRHK